jgi:hypothetical protein
VRRAYGLAGRTEGRLARQVLRPGWRAYGGWAGPCGRVPGLGQAVRLAAAEAADDGPGWWLRLPNLQLRQRRDRPERPAVPQVGLRMGLQIEPQGSGAAA